MTRRNWIRFLALDPVPVYRPMALYLRGDCHRTRHARLARRQLGEVTVL